MSFDRGEWETRTTERNAMEWPEERPVVRMSGKPGRPPVGPQVSIAMSPDMLARIDAAAASAGVSRAEWVRRACAAALG